MSAAHISTLQRSKVEDLQDYSGDFVPNLRWQHFSKDALIKLLTECQRALIMLDGFWHTRVARELDEKTADAWGAEVWGREYVQFMIPRIMKAMHIQGTDVETYMKYLQIDPGLPLELWECDYDLRSKDHCIWTVNRCPSLLFMEKEGRGRESIVCQSMEVAAVQGYARFFNPKIRVTPKKLPPRRTRDELPHCQWEFKMEG